jgi:peroxiredoxin
MGLRIGDRAPDFSLPGVDGKTHTLQEYALKRVLVVVFTCNHCPYAQAYEDRLKAMAQFYGVQGVQFIGINPNDDSSYPEESFARMKERAARRGFTFPYLRDATQDVAKRFGALTTPEAFVFDSKRLLRYHGRIDDSWRLSERVKEHTLREAISAVLSGGEIREPEKSALGCTIKWKWGK